VALAAARPHSRLLLVASATNPFDRLSSGIQKAEMHVRAVTDCVKIARVNVTPWRRRKATVRAISRTVTARRLRDACRRWDRHLLLAQRIFGAGFPLYANASGDRGPRL